MAVIIVVLLTFFLFTACFSVLFYAWTVTLHAKPTFDFRDERGDTNGSGGGSDSTSGFGSRSHIDATAPSFAESDRKLTLSGYSSHSLHDTDYERIPDQPKARTPAWIPPEEDTHTASLPPNTDATDPIKGNYKCLRAWPALRSVVRCFDLPNNLRSFYKGRDGANRRTYCLDGLRTMSMMWVIFGHCWIWPWLANVQYTNTSYLLPLGNNHSRPKALASTWTGQVIHSADLATDTFFFLSGFLHSYVLLKKTLGRSARFVVPISNSISLKKLQIAPS